MNVGIFVDLYVYTYIHIHICIQWEREFQPVDDAGYRLRASVPLHVDFLILTLYVSYLGLLSSLVAAIPGQASSPQKKSRQKRYCLLWPRLVGYTASLLHSIFRGNQEVRTRCKERENRLHDRMRRSKILEIQLGPEMLLWHFKFQKEQISDRRRCVAGAL